MRKNQILSTFLAKSRRFWSSVSFWISPGYGSHCVVLTRECPCWRESSVHWNKKSNLDKALKKNAHSRRLFLLVRQSASNQNRWPFWKTTAKMCKNVSLNCLRLYEAACFIVFVFKTFLSSVFETLLLILILKTCLSLWGDWHSLWWVLKLKNLYLIRSHPKIFCLETQFHTVWDTLSRKYGWKLGRRMSSSI